MAKVTGPLGSAQAIGPVGALIYLPDRTSTWVGKRPCEHVPVTGPAVSHRAAVASIISTWQDLNTTEIASWIHADLPHANAFQNFLTLNSRLALLGSPPIRSLPDRDYRPKEPAWPPALISILGEPPLWAFGDDRPRLWHAAVFVSFSTLRRTSISARKLAFAAAAPYTDNFLTIDNSPAYKTLAWRILSIDDHTGNVFHDSGLHIADLTESE